jgi:pumilio RNA-binding family
MMGGTGAGGIMTPHGFIPTGNPALHLGGYQQHNPQMSMGTVPGQQQIYMGHGGNHHTANSQQVGGGGGHLHPHGKHDHHQQDHHSSTGPSSRRSNTNSLGNNGRMGSSNRSGNHQITTPQSGTATSTGSALRDTLVEDFRNTSGKTKQWELKDLIGHVVPFCQDQHGSRFIQQRLEVASDSDKQLIFDEVLPQALSLMTDVFGNYVIQKLFEFGSSEQCETLASLLPGHTVNLAMQMYGCRVIQKALEYVQTPRLILLVNEFEGPPVLRCVHDQNGNHVIQKCIEIISRVAKASSASYPSSSETKATTEYLNSRLLFILQSFHGRIRELSIHPYGCRVIQRILEYCQEEHKLLILTELRSHSRELIQDQYGNYVIQHVMQYGYDDDRTSLLDEIQSKLLEYSQHKFASNVVEKCLQFAEKGSRDEIIWTIINVTFDLNQPVDVMTGQCVLENMVRDPYANYVVQKVIDVSNETQRGAIIRYVRENIVQLRRYTYGKHIIVRLEKVSGEKF